MSLPHHITTFKQFALQQEYHQQTLKNIHKHKNIMYYKPQICLSEINESNLVQIKGIGKKLAHNIMIYKAEHSLKQINDLDPVKGIGSKKLQVLQQKINEKC